LYPRKKAIEPRILVMGEDRNRDREDKNRST
jgi:hypothetical protein